jgi:predicted CxxxxCH...CXXCH cytochrome family protein
VFFPSPTGATTAGAHAKHATSSGYNYACQTCHFNGMPTTAIIEDPLLLQMGFSVVTNGAVYDGRVLQDPYLYDATNGTTVTTNGAMTCSNTYCHSNGTGGTMNMGTPGTSPLGDPRPVAMNTSPPWTESGPLACTYCHGYPPSYPQDDPKSNSHMYGQAAGEGHRHPCNYCHYGTTTNGVTITNLANHANGIYDVQPDPNVNYAGPLNFTYAYDAGGGKCSAISCHGGTDYYWGRISILAPIVASYGPACYQVQMFPSFSGGTSPYTCDWNFGDGMTASGCSADHVFASAGPFSVTVSGRDANAHPFSSTQSITPQAVNIPPTVNETITVSCSVVTLTDLSIDPDATTCGHSGTALETINWGNGTTSGNVNLSGSPSNAIFTRTYTTGSVYNIIHTVRDNANATVSHTTTGVRVPSTHTVSGQVTSGGVGLSGVLMVLKQNGVTTRATATTDANGNYSFSYSAPCGNNWTVTASRAGYTFANNPRTFNIIGLNVTINFVTQ